MVTAARQLRQIINEAKPRLLSLSEAQASTKPYADKWALKEILGHLIDSAANNHQRFVRMQEMRDLGALWYEQEHWVNSQQYRSESWSNLVILWHSYNTHLAHVVEHIDPAKLDHTCDIGHPKPATLRYVVEDYLRHMQHHLGQIFDGDDPQRRKQWEIVQ